LSALAQASPKPLCITYLPRRISAALHTSFYMTRLMLYAFHRTNRTGEAERAHLHEAPWSMTGPLAVLGLLSFAGGVINVPALFGGHAFLHRWLAPVTAVADQMQREVALPPGVEWTLVVAAVLVAGLGMFGAVRLRQPQAPVPAR